MNLSKNKNIFSGILILSLMAIMIQKELQGIELNQYLWKNRIILTFADDEDHADLIKLKVEMKENNCEILNRDLLHFHFSNDGKIGNHTTTNDQSFRILLIGKDGGIKYESNQYVSLIQLFKLIDSMPMRQDEMVHDRC
jgi:hypothetical protein